MSNRILTCRRLLLTPVFLVLLSAAVAAAPATTNRDSIPDLYKWDLSVVYSDWESWEADFTEATSWVDSLAALKGYPSKGPDQLQAFLEFSDRVGIKVDHLSLFAGLSYVTDMDDNQLGAAYQRIEHLEASLAEATSWLEPELLELAWDTVSNWLQTNEGLADYSYWLENLFRLKPHYLNEAQEKLLAYFAGFNNSPDRIYSDFVYNDIQYSKFIRPGGDTLRLTEGQIWYQMRVNRNQAERREMFRTFYEAYHDYVNTYAAMYNSVLQRDWAIARARNYESTLGAALSRDNVPVEVYENLVQTVRDGTGPLQRYHRLRKQAMGLEHYYWSDRQVGLTDFDRSYEYDEALPWVQSALAPLGDDYGRQVADVFANRRIDVYENDNKYTGGFQSDAYGTPPFILLNFNGTLEEVFTIAHEMGHAVHGIYSNAHQAYPNAYATIFVAEVPSTVNEFLLLDYLLEEAEDPRERLEILQQAIENIEGSFYLQTMFADFEWRAHQLVENGEPVTAESLRAVYGELLNDYYGDAVEMDSLYHSYWTRIGHFFESPYYVYKYATSLAGAAKYVEGILSDDPDMHERTLADYHSLLQAGGNDYPMDQLSKFGVDMSSPDVLQAVVTRLDELVTRFEEELSRL